jgi:hypothetical protein
MNDFKKMPKMADGGSVKKYSEGSSVTFDRSPKNREYAPVEMPSRFGAPKKSDKTPVDMPGRLGEPKRTINIPGMGEINRADIQARKAGGKVKRGNKKK